MSADLTPISAPFAAALASLQQGLTNATKEISTLHKNVVAKKTQRQKLAVELTRAKAALDAKRLEAHKVETVQQELQKELNEFNYQLDAVKQQKATDEARATKLEEGIIDIEYLKQKTAAAEQQKADLQNQLSALQAALAGLVTPSNDDTATNPTPAPAATPAPLEVEETHDASTFVCAMDGSAECHPVTNTTPVAVTGPEPTNTTAVTEPEPAVPLDSRYKTRLCQFHLKGECKRGAKCTFAHSEQELRFNPGKYHKQVSTVAAMGFNVDIAVIGALFQECNGNMERVLNHILITS